MLGNRYSQHSFAQVPDVNIVRSKFDRSFTVKDTMDFDYLNPIFVDEILPGDTCNLTLNTFARLATQKVPIMDNLYIDYFFFFVPNRLVWTNWEKFNGAQDDPGDSTDFTIPVVQINTGTGAQVGSIYDKMGIPTDIDNIKVNALPLRAYNLIWNTWFRSQDLEPSIAVSKDDGPDADTEYTLLKRGKRHDYFTSALPTPQKGPAVGIDMTGTGIVERLSNASAWRGYQAGTDTLNATAGPIYTHSTANNGVLYNNTTSGQLSLDPMGGLTVPGDSFYFDISSLRESIAVQSIYELDQRGGTRYVEILQNHFNVTSPDYRLQRPEYLGGGESRINLHPVPQTSPTSGSNAQGQLAAFGTASSAGQNIGFTKSFTEHGYVIGLACPRADITYQQGINRMWLRQTRFDFFWPKLQEIGEQAVHIAELRMDAGMDPTTGNLGGVWGYQERYAEYRYKPSEIHGLFRSQAASAIDQWHMAEEFPAAPTPMVLNGSFIEQSTPIERSIAVTNEPHLLFDAFFKYLHARPMLTYSIPSTLGRF